ncbi:MAG: histidine kinase [Bacteroidia bacterium]|nr:histidine kinase [Bacteroidia bacterium]
MQSQVKGRFNELSLQLTIPFTVTQFSTRDGLPQNQVTEIIPRNGQSLLLNTANGIVTFNGYSFKTLINDSTYKKQFFHKVEYMAKNKFVFGCDLARDFFMLSPTYKKINIAGLKVHNFTKSGDSLLLLTNTSDIYSYNINTGTSRLILPHSLLNNLPKGIYGKLTCHQQQLYICSRQYGIYRFNMALKSGEWLSHESAFDLKINTVNNRIYAFAGKHLYEVSDSLITLKQFDNHENLEVNCIGFRGADEIYLGTNTGLFAIHEDYYEYYGRKEGLFSESVYSLYYDSIQDCLFAGTGEKGLQKLTFKCNYSFSASENISPGGLSSIIKTNAGQVLITESRGKISTLGVVSTEPYITKNALFSSLAEIKGKLFVGTWGDGILIYAGNKLIDSVGAPNLPGLQIFSCFADSKGLIWVGTNKGLARGINEHSLQPILTNLITETIISFYELRDGTICVAAVGCFYLIKNNRIMARFDHKSGLKGKEVRSFYEDDEGKLWIGTYGGGLFCYHQNTLTSINAKNGCMLDADVFCLAEDGMGYLLITSNHGLWRLSQKALNDFYYNKLNYLVPFIYDEETGILNTEFNGGFQNNYAKSFSNHFYFPTIEGMVMTFPDQLTQSQLLPVIDNVFINDTLLHQLNKNKLTHNSNSLQIDFSCVNLANKRNVYFQHKLIGETNYDWTTPSKSRTVYLRMLPPGEYRFQVRAIDGFNEANPTVTTYEFEIVPLFYQRLWFKLMVAGILLLGIILLARNRVQVVRQRTEEIELYSRKVAEIELKAIQAQLNPHFIFNCLNSIKYSIMAKDFENANSSLNTFASLIRNTLENYDKFFVPFNKELKFITDYIELEKLRLKELLTYEIVGSEIISPESMIPHLIIQPHIENAIKHGITHLENKTGFLKIEFEKDEAQIMCTITDNGIGREASRLLNAKSNLHTAKGTQLTYEKSGFLKQYINYTCTIQIIDLTYSNNEAIGTRVIIKLPNSNDHRNNR